MYRTAAVGGSIRQVKKRTQHQALPRSAAVLRIILAYRVSDRGCVIRTTMRVIKKRMHFSLSRSLLGEMYAYCSHNSLICLCFFFSFPSVALIKIPKNQKRSGIFLTCAFSYQGNENLGGLQHTRKGFESLRGNAAGMSASPHPTIKTDQNKTGLTRF